METPPSIDSIDDLPLKLPFFGGFPTGFPFRFSHLLAAGLLFVPCIAACASCWMEVMQRRQAGARILFRWGNGSLNVGPEGSIWARHLSSIMKSKSKPSSATIIESKAAVQTLSVTESYSISAYQIETSIMGTPLVYW